MTDLPHQNADVNAAASALAGLSAVPDMAAALIPVSEARDRQAERVAVARNIAARARRAAEEADAVVQREAADLVAMDAAIIAHQSTIQEARDQRRMDRESELRRDAKAEAHRRGLVQAGLARLGADGSLADTFGGTT